MPTLFLDAKRAIARHVTLRVHIIIREIVELYLAASRIHRRELDLILQDEIISHQMPLHTESAHVPNTKNIKKRKAREEGDHKKAGKRRRRQGQQQHCKE